MNYFYRVFNSMDLFRQAFYKHKKKILVLIVLGFIGGFLGGIGIGAIVPLFSFIGENNQAGDDFITGFFKGIFSLVGLEFTLPWMMFVLVCIFLAKAVLLYIANLISSRATTEYEEETRNDLFRSTLKADWPYLMDHKVGYLTHIISEDVNVAASLLASISVIVLFTTSFIMYAAVAVSISPTVTLITFLIGVVMFFVLKPLFYKIRKLSKYTNVVSKKTSHHINQHIIGAKTVKSTAIEAMVLEKGREYFSQLSRAKFNLSKFQNIISTFLEPITLLVVMPIFFLSYKDPAFNIASFAAILYLVQKMFSFIQSMQIRFSLINESIPHLTSILSYQAEARKNREEPVIDGRDFSFESNMQFKDVDFSYKGNPKNVLSGFNLEIKKGRTSGLIGPSGAGKTTVVDLVLRLVTPTGGGIYIDGKDLNEFNVHKWRQAIGYVSQDIFLLNDTVRENIRFYNDAITDEDIIEAAKLANIHDFIMEQVDGLETIVGERGLHLSAGQRQRIVLARVLATRPKILLLDEATSALDNDSELAIQKAIAGLKGKMTIIIVAHRLSTVIDTDELMVIDDGRIIEKGSPNELLADKNSYFHKTYNIRN